MSERLTRHPLAIAAVLLTVLGLVLSIRGLAGAPARVRKIQDKAERLERLQEVAREQQAPDALLEALDRDQATVPADLHALLREALPGASYDLEEGDPKALRDGWSLRTARLTLGDVPFAQAAGAVARMENGRPPWRITEYTVIPGPVSGRGRLTLIAEALAK